MGLVDDLVGQRFGFLTVISKDPVRGNWGQVYWNCICDCGNKTRVLGANLKRKDENRTISCGKCYHISIGEQQIKEILDKNNITYDREFVFPDFINHRYDFALLKDKQPVRLIEFDGEQHFRAVSVWDKKASFEERQRRDKIKNEYALSHNIPLVRIPYWERDNITLDMILGDKYLVT